MGRSGEIWIVHADPHERGLVEGAWSLAVVELEAAGTEAGPSWVIAEQRIRCCLQGLIPCERILTPSSGRLPRRSPLFTTEVYDGIESLMTLAASMEQAPPSAVRAFGLRAGVAGRIFAESRGVPMKAVLVCPPAAEVDANGEALLRTRRALENWVTAGATEVLTLTPEQADLLRRRVLPDGAEIRAFDTWTQDHRARASERSAVAVLASATDADGNEVVLRSLAALLKNESGFRVHWMARRGSVTAMRAAQDFRRFGLASVLHWEDEPWMNPPWRTGDWWDLLIVVREGRQAGPAPSDAKSSALAIRIGTQADPEASVSEYSPIAAAALAAGVPVMAVSTEDSCETVAEKILSRVRSYQSCREMHSTEALQPERR